MPAPKPLWTTDDFHSRWAIHACHLELAPPHEKKLRHLACLSPEVAEELQGYVSPTASFEEVHQALAFMMKPEESQQVMLERFHTRAQQPGETIREIYASLAKLARTAFPPHGEGAPLLQRLISAVKAPALAMSFAERPPTTIFEALDRGHRMQSLRTFAEDQGATHIGREACNIAPTPRPQKQAWHPRFNPRPRYTPQWQYNRDPHK